MNFDLIFEQTPVAQLGIKETKDVANAVVEVINAGSRAYQDGTINAADIGQALILFPAIVEAATGWEKVGAEIKDLDANEKVELASVFDRIDLQGEEDEQDVAAAFKGVLALTALISRRLKKKGDTGVVDAIAA